MLPSHGQLFLVSLISQSSGIDCSQTSRDIYVGSGLHIYVLMTQTSLQLRQSTAHRQNTALVLCTTPMSAAGVESDKNVPPTACRLEQSLERLVKECSFPNIRNLIVSFEPYKNTILYRNIFLALLFEDKKGAIIQGNERGANGSDQVWHASCCISVQGEEQSVSAGSPYGERVRG